MKKIVLLTIVAVLTVLNSFGNDGMHPRWQIDFVKKRLKAKEEPYYHAYLALLIKADSALNATSHALADFAVPGYYDKPQEHRQNSLALQRDAFDAYACALAYRLSGERQYGKKAVYFLNAWATINKRYSEHDGVLVMAYSGSALLLAAGLLDGDKVWKKNDEERFKTWVSSVYQPACNRIRHDKNNWADWGRFGSLLSASFLEDKAEIAENTHLIKSDIFLKIDPDGKMPEEIKRGNNGIWYTYFSLAPMTASCWLIYNLTGENLYTLEHNGASIKKALDYLFYYNQHAAEWKWNSKPNVGDLKLWPANLLEAMSGIYHEQHYTDYVKDSRPHMYSIHHFAWVFPTLMPVSLSPPE